MADIAQVPARGPAPVPIAVVYNTSMQRPDAALALAAMYAFSNRRDSRVGAVCVAGAGLRTAIFCDIVNRFFRPSPGGSNQNIPIGLAAVTPLPSDSPMIATAVDRKKENGDPQYVRSIARLSDTSQVEAALRNGVTLSPESAVILSAPATGLASSLDLLGAKDLYKQRVKRLVVVGAGSAQQDPAALRKVIAEWPTPIVFCGREVGEALALPGASVEKAFASAKMHPVVDAYRAFKPMPYDIPAYDLAAMYYLVKPDADFFTLSDAGTLSVNDAGAIAFAPGSGNVRRLVADPAKKSQAVEALLAIASTEPPPPPAPRGRGAA